MEVGMALGGIASPMVCPFLDFYCKLNYSF